MSAEHWSLNHFESCKGCLLVLDSLYSHVIYWLEMLEFDYLVQMADCQGESTPSNQPHHVSSSPETETLRARASLRD